MKTLLQQALDALEQCTYDEEGYLLNPDNEEVIAALKRELAKDEPEPYGLAVSGTSHIYTHSLAFAAAEADAKRTGGTAIPLYTKGTTNV